MAKRKQKFKYHGKCCECGAAIMDWRERGRIQCSKLFDPELTGRLLVPYQWCTTCRPTAQALDSIRMLSAPLVPYDELWHSAISGRVSASKPNMQNITPGGSALKFAPTTRLVLAQTRVEGPQYVAWRTRKNG